MDRKTLKHIRLKVFLLTWISEHNATERNIQPFENRLEQVSSSGSVLTV